jgi:hypothetical protein
MASFNLNEQTTSHVPALHLLSKMGYQYLPPQEALALRGGTENTSSGPLLIEKSTKDGKSQETKINIESIMIFHLFT